MWLLVRILALCVFVGFIECNTDVRRRIFIPCFRRDTICQRVSAQLAYQNIVRGVPSLGIVSSDPLYQKEISGTFNGLIYNWTEVTTTGSRTCVVNYFRLDVSLANLRLNLTCATGTIKGKYNINGELFGRKVNESSNFTARATSSVFLGANLKLKQVQGDDGKKHLLIEDVKTYATTLGPIVVKLENSDDLERFVNAHQRETDQLIASTFVDSDLKLIAARANIFLKSVAIDDLFLNIGIPGIPDRAG